MEFHAHHEKVLKYLDAGLKISSGFVKNHCSHATNVLKLRCFSLGQLCQFLVSTGNQPSVMSRKQRAENNNVLDTYSTVRYVDTNRLVMESLKLEPCKTL